MRDAVVGRVPGVRRTGLAAVAVALVLGAAVLAPVSAGAADATTNAAATSRPAALTWSPPHGVDLGSVMTSVSCATSTFCAAVTRKGEAVEFDGRAWSFPVPADPHPGNSLDSVSCASRTFCMAVDTGGMAVSFDGRSWSAPVTFLPASFGSGGVTSVSCAAVKHCVAVAEDVAVSFNGTWARPVVVSQPSAPLWSISCPSVKSCAAVTTAGRPYVLHGRKWSTPVAHGPSKQFLLSVSCPTTRFCVAVGPNSALAQFNGRSWQFSRPHGQKVNRSAVSCGSPSFCLGTSSFSPQVMSFNGSTWSRGSSVGSLVALTSVSCVSSRLCVVGAVDGSVVVGRAT